MPFSRLREDYLVNYLENQVVAELLKVQALMLSSLLPLSGKSKYIAKNVFDKYEAYCGIVLPNNKKLANIKDIPKTEIKAIKDNLAAMKKLMQQPKAVTNKKLTKKPPKP